MATIWFWNVVAVANLTSEGQLLENAGCQQAANTQVLKCL